MGRPGRRAQRARGHPRQRGVGPARGAGRPLPLDLRRERRLPSPEAAQHVRHRRRADPSSQLGANSGYHSGQLSPDGTFFYGTTTGFEGFIAPLGPCLTVIDLLDPRHPKVVTRWGGGFPCHDLGFDPTGDRAFVGTYSTARRPPRRGGRPRSRRWVCRRSPSPAWPCSTPARCSAACPGRSIMQTGTLRGGDQHTETFARIGGRDYVIGAEEATCPNGNARIVDVTDAARPKQVSKITLGVNRPAAAPTPCSRPSGTTTCCSTRRTTCRSTTRATPASPSSPGTPPGLRVFDIRDPEHPVEVAYFNPPVPASSTQLHDSTTTYPRYVPETGQIWVGSGVNAFWVVELDPRLRPEALRGQPLPKWSPKARRDRPERGLREQPHRHHRPRPDGLLVQRPDTVLTVDDDGDRRRGAGGAGPGRRSRCPAPGRRRPVVAPRGDRPRHGRLVHGPDGPRRRCHARLASPRRHRRDRQHRPHQRRRPLHHLRPRHPGLTNRRT